MKNDRKKAKKRGQAFQMSEKARCSPAGDNFEVQRQQGDGNGHDGIAKEYEAIQFQVFLFFHMDPVVDVKYNKEDE